MGSSTGRLFRISTWGESHGGGIGVVVDGCPGQLPLEREDIQAELDRRRPGQSRIVTPRKESDEVEILSGVFEGLTLGTPIAMLVRNADARPSAYDEMKDKFRPSHADFTYEAKYGIRAWQGGGRASARETIGRVAAGAIARKILKAVAPGYQAVAYVRRVHELETAADLDQLDARQVEGNIVRACDAEAATPMIELIEKARSDGDSLGGIVECVIRNVPAGLGEPVFDKLEADLAKAMMSLPATKGFEIGSGFAGTFLTGREHNDAFYMEGDRVRTRSNRSGGVQGGISNGEDIVFRVAFKPTATIMSVQETVDRKGQGTELMGRGRHDPCVLPRAVPMVEAMAHLVLVDHLLRQRAQNQGWELTVSPEEGQGTV